MISPQHIDYIRFQTGRGVSREEITNSLRLNGVTDEDIQDGFAQMIANPSVMTVSGAVPAPPQTVWLSEENRVGNGPVVSKIWGTFVPASNKSFLVASCILIFTLDLFILVTSPALYPFFIEMIAVLGIGYLFTLRERAYTKMFASSTHKIDGFILSLIEIRHFVFFLNFIPLIQMLGAWLTAFVGIPYLIAYAIAIQYRKKHTPTVA
ncbi:MAG: hypothetical protein KBC16_01855 [Candidatus Pacebacteria bacterium]|nr:hypothetical protein [Candidatus Paceibacterota bacterium]